MSSQRHTQHLSSYMKARKCRPAKNTLKLNQSESQRSLPSSSSMETSAAKKDLNYDKIFKTVQSRAKREKEHQIKPAKHLDYINRNPDEVLFIIFKFLTPSQLLVCAQVCSRWSIVLKDRKLWEGIFPRFPKGLRKLFTFEETKEDGFDWKKEIILRCIKIRKNKFLSTKKKADPYTGLPNDVPKLLKALSIKWKLCFTDTKGQNHWSTAEEMAYFASSLSTRWLSLQLPPLSTLKEMKVFACAPVFFDKSWKPHTESATTSSLLLHYDLKGRGTARPIMRDKSDAECDMISAHFLPPGLLVTCWLASWKDGGEVAFVTACFSYHQLLERILLGSSTMSYKAPLFKPILDDIDSQYGLHGYSAMVELRNHKSSYWSQQFRELYHTGFTSDSVLFWSLGSEYGVFSKKLSLPWKTELFRNILQNVCFFDMTIIDEHGRPIWCVSSPVKIHVKSGARVDYSADGESFFMEYCDDKGSVRMEFVWNSALEQTRIADVEFRIRKICLDSWFGTSYC